MKNLKENTINGGLFFKHRISNILKKMLQDFHSNSGNNGNMTKQYDLSVLNKLLGLTFWRENEEKRENERNVQWTEI